jgi:hypothetical protein
MRLPETSDESEFRTSNNRRYGSLDGGKASHATGNQRQENQPQKNPAQEPCICFDR